MQSKAPQRYGYADLIAYALSVIDEPTCNEPTSYKEAIECDEKAHWLKAMRE